MAMEIKLYKPQMKALTTAATEILYGGAAGGGKSHLIRAASIVFSLEIPGINIYIFRRTYKEVLDNHVYTPGGFLEMLKPWLDTGECVFHKTDSVFAWSNGSRIKLCHSQHEGDIYSHQGAQIQFLIIDEATHFTPPMIKFIRSRVRLGSLQIPDKWKDKFPRIMYCSNPGGVGHHYFKTNFVDYGPYIKHFAPEDDGSMLREYIPARLSDNLMLSQNDPLYKNRLMGMGDAATVKAMLDGDWDMLNSGGFSDIWKAKYHVIEPFEIPFTWKIDRGYDYGSSKPAVCLWFAESDGSEFVDRRGNICWVPAGTIFQIAELYFADKNYDGLRLTSHEQGLRIKQFERDEGLDWRTKPGPADNSIFSAEPGHVSVAEDMAKSGITFVRSNKAPGSRIIGAQLFRSRLEASTKRPMENPGYLVFSSCHNTIRTIPSLEDSGKHDGDIDTSGEDHCWDVIRYRVLKYSTQVKLAKVEGA